MAQKKSIEKDSSDFDGTEMDSRIELSINESLAKAPKAASYRENITPEMERGLLSLDGGMKTPDYRQASEKVRRMYNQSTLNKFRILASCYDPTSIANTCEQCRKLGYRFSEQQVKRFSKDQHFIELWQAMIRPLVAGNIAKAADVQAAVTNIMIDPKATNLEKLRAAELMGKFLHAFDNTVRVEGTLQAIVGVVTGVPSNDREVVREVTTQAVKSAVAAEQMKNVTNTNDGEND